MKSVHVKLIYFKRSGKYYSEGELDIKYAEYDPPPMFSECVQHVVNDLNAGKRPGLVDGMDFDVLVTVYSEYGPLPYLLVRDADGRVGDKASRA